MKHGVDCDCEERALKLERDAFEYRTYASEEGAAGDFSRASFSNQRASECMRDVRALRDNCTRLR